MDKRSYAILITTDNEVMTMVFSKKPESIFDYARQVICCEWIEPVHTQYLEKNDMCMLIDEEGKLKDVCYLNKLATELYNSPWNDTIVGNAMIVKITEDDFDLLTKKEMEKLRAKLVAMKG